MELRPAVPLPWHPRISPDVEPVADADHQLTFAQVSPALFSAREEGSSLLGFALTISLLLTLLFGIMDVSRAVYVDHFVANASREASRYAMVRGSSWTQPCISTLQSNCVASSASIAAYVRLISPAGIDPTRITVVTLWPGTDATGALCTQSSSSASPGCVVSIKILYRFSFALPFLPKAPILIPSISRVTIIQ